MAYGDQPALILEQIEWALLNGFEVICAGKGTKYHKTFEDSTPETVWQHYGIKAKDALSSGMNPKMFNSFLTGDKSSIEMAAVANSSHLKVPDTGLNYPCINTNQIAKQLIPMDSGGLLEKNRQLEVITSIDENKKEIDNHLRWGVFLVFKGKNKQIFPHSVSGNKVSFAFDEMLPGTLYFRPDQENSMFERDPEKNIIIQYSIFTGEKIKEIPLGG